MNASQALSLKQPPKEARTNKDKIKSSSSEDKDDLQINNDYGEEDEYIKTVEDDILDNKYSLQSLTIEEENSIQMIQKDRPISKSIKMNKNKAKSNNIQSQKQRSQVNEEIMEQPEIYINEESQQQRLFSQGDMDQENDNSLSRSRSGSTIRSTTQDKLAQEVLPLNIQIDLGNSPGKMKKNSKRRTNYSQQNRTSQNYQYNTNIQGGSNIIIKVSSRNKGGGATRQESKTIRTSSQVISKSPYTQGKLPQEEFMEKEIKKMREKVYFFEFVKPLHMKQQANHQQREQLYKKLIQRAQNYSRHKNDDNPAQNYKQQEDFSAGGGVISPHCNLQIEKKVKNLRISDYFKGKKANLRSSSTCQVGSSKSAQSQQKPFNSSFLNNHSQQNNLQQQQNQSEYANNQSENTIHINNDSDNVYISQSIFNSETNKLKREYIDTDKALAVMNSFKMKESKMSTTDPLQQQNSSILNVQTNAQNESIEIAPGEKRKKDWNEFLSFIKTNPEAMLNLVPSPSHINHNHPETIEYTSAKLISSSGLNSQQQRPNSSYNQIGYIWSKSRIGTQGRQIRTGYGQRTKKLLPSDYGSMKPFHPSNYNNRRPMTTNNNVYRSKSSMEKNRPSQYSTQYSNHQFGGPNEDGATTLQSKIDVGGGGSNNRRDQFSAFMSNKEAISSGEILSQKGVGNIQHDGQNQHQIQGVKSQKFQDIGQGGGGSNGKSYGMLNSEKESIYFASNKASSKFNQYSKKDELKQGPSLSLIENLKYPVGTLKKNVNPIQQKLQEAKNLQALDISIDSLQKQCKTQFRLYEKTNQKNQAKSLQRQLRQKKPAKFNLSKDLAQKFNVDEYKQNSSPQKYTRQVNSLSPQQRRHVKLMDWKNSTVKKKMDEGKLLFNEEATDQQNSKSFKEDEIEYMINLLRYSTKDFTNIDILKPLFNKSLNTLEKIMEELMLGPLFDKISVRILDITPENTLKIMIRCKMMLQCRKQVIHILQIIEVRESKMKELNYFVIQGDTASNNLDPQAKAERESVLRVKVKELNDITVVFVSKVREFLGLKRIFGKVFIYDGMDYLKVVVNEVRQIKDILTMFGIALEEEQFRLDTMQQQQQLQQHQQQNTTIGMMIADDNNSQYQQQQQSFMQYQNNNSIFDEYGSKENTLKMEGISTIGYGYGDNNSGRL